MDFDNLAAVSSAVCYLDAKRMYRWLEDAFGLEPNFVISDADGNLMHSEMLYERCRIMVGNEWSEDHKSPLNLGGKNTQTIHIQLKDGIDAHCERARAAGAEILREPQDQFYGDRTYRARDLEGHIWTFGQTTNAMEPAEWDKVIGSVTTTRLP